MSRRAAIIVAVAVLLAVPLGAAYAENGEVPSRIEEIRSQIMDLRRELVREKAKAGIITEEQAAMMLERMEQAVARRAEMRCGECREDGPRRPMLRQQMKHRMWFRAPGERPAPPDGPSG